MLAKYQTEPRTIKAVTDFRLIKQHITNARRIKAIKAFSSRLKRFAEEPEIKLDSLEIEEASIHADAKSIVRKLISIENLIKDLDSDQFYGEEELWTAMERLIQVLERKLKKADKRR